MQASVKSAVRALEILHYFEVHRAPIHMKGLAEKLGYPQSSMTGLLHTLTARGYLHFDRKTWEYFPSMRVHSMGKWLPAAHFGSGEIIKAVHELNRLTGETIVIASRNDIYLQYTVTTESTHAVRFHAEPGSIHLMYESALGLMLMATLKDAEIDTIIRRSNIAQGLPTAHKVDEILFQVRRARELSYCYAENVPFLGAASLSIVMPQMIQGQAVVLGCGGCGAIGSDISA